MNQNFDPFSDNSISPDPTHSMQQNPDDYQYTSVFRTPAIKEQKVSGTFGAFIGSLAGGILYFILYQCGFIASISGLAGIYCSIELYKRFAGKMSKYGLVISVIFTFLSFFGASFLTIVYEVIKVCQENHGDVLVYLYNLPILFGNQEFLSAYAKDLIIGLAFMFLGTVRTIANYKNALQ